MSYRTCVEGKQIFGNHEYYSEWIEFIKSQGVTVDEDGNYDGYITDFMGALVVIETIVLRLNKEREELKEKLNGSVGVQKIESLFDFTNIPNKLIEQEEFHRTHEGSDPKYDNSLFDLLIDAIDNTYAFMPYVFYQACKSKLDKEHIYTTNGHFHCYKLKKDQKIHVRAR